ncbi:MAG TPA: TonB family protein [Candidatus Angelobacter sp.]|nr:TonB family protein [Candidatus Angelobacter sp.]
MAPIIKENETLTATAESPARSAATPGSNGDAAKQQPVALEVAVTVNGARSIDGSDKREPFSETTKTVLIFGNGAVIRLTSSVAPGQLLFLTNERTKKEVVCQVVKSKNYRNVSGYVELEFTEPVVGFWGMRFPGDRIGTVPAPAPAAIPPAAFSAPAPPRPAAPISSPRSSIPASPAASHTSSIVPPPMDSASLLGSTKPRPAEVPVAAAPPAPVVTPPAVAPPPAAAIPQLPGEFVAPAALVPTTPNFDLSRQADEQASFLAPTAQAPRVPSTIDLSSLAPFFEVKPAATAAVPPPPAAVAPPPPPPVSSAPATEELKQHTARLQEQLSSMLFAEPSQAAPVHAKVPPTPVQEKKELQESIAQVLEFSKPAAPKAEPVFAEPVEPVKAVSERKISSLEEEELKIPAWLEPLARNASAPSSTQELILREKARRQAERNSNEEISEEPIAPPSIPALEEEAVSEVRVPEFGSALAIDENRVPVATGSKGSGKGLLFGAIAAGVVLAAAGGWWYMNQQPAATHSGVSASSAAISSPSPALTAPPKPEAAAPASVSVQSEPPVTRNSPAETGAAGQNRPAASSAAAASPSLSVVSIRNAQPSPSSSGKANASAAAENSRQAQPEEERKSSLGEVRLAAPKVSQNRNSQSTGDADAGVSLEDGQSDNAADALGSGLSVGNKGPTAPAAPLPVGGDVKQAKLITSVQPIYPELAKNQHVSGNVTIDALIDANGRVTTMKVMSGPTLLHQAAMDALKQWKYQPAMLDGKPVAMHLTVTLQFRLQ